MERAEEAFHAMWEGKTHGKTVFTDEPSGPRRRRLPGHLNFGYGCGAEPPPFRLRFLSWRCAVFRPGRSHDSAGRAPQAAHPWTVGHGVVVVALDRFVGLPPLCLKRFLRRVRWDQAVATATDQVMPPGLNKCFGRRTSFPP